MAESEKAKSLKDEYEVYAAKREEVHSDIVVFEGVDGADVYNPSIPFTDGGRTVMACRVQRRTGRDSRTLFFTPEGKVWHPILEGPEYPLEDPFVTFIQGELVFGGVWVEWEGERALSWQTRFYKGKDIFSLKEFARGPAHMKDIRLLELPDGKVAVCTRPQGEAMLRKHGCIAKIGFTVVDGLDHLTPEVIENAPYLEGLFLPNEWGGANQLHYLENGKIGVIGHKAYKEAVGGKEYLHYYGIAFGFDPVTLETTPVSVIGARDCFTGGDCRTPRLRDVIFTAGIVQNGDGAVDLYTGLSDCQVGKMTIQNPFRCIY